MRDALPVLCAPCARRVAGVTFPGTWAGACVVCHATTTAGHLRSGVAPGPLVVRLRRNECTGATSTPPRAVRVDVAPWDAGPFVARALGLRRFADHLRRNPALVDQAHRELAGSDLACGLGPHACHADVWLAALDGSLDHAGRFPPVPRTVPDLAVLECGVLAAALEGHAPPLRGRFGDRVHRGGFVVDPLEDVSAAVRVALEGLVARGFLAAARDCRVADPAAGVVCFHVTRRGRAAARTLRREEG